ncbi:MAG: hypothetical protein KKE50_05095 [Nanoarchaeota archaeon]|nr:hypothetical protein [Nanoarchaeota archaeon]
MINNKAVMSCIQISILTVAIFAFAFILSPQASADISTVTVPETTSCCEKTTYGAWCQNSKTTSCNSAFRTTPTSCEATSFCKLGCCYNSNEGTCSENTPQLVCQQNNGVWADSASCEIPQCDLGCCVLDNQAAFVTLVRCKKLSGFFGLQTNFRTDITSESACIATAQAQDRGACVFEEDFTRTCKFTTRDDCTVMSTKKSGNSTISSNITFHKDYLCTAEELGTNCGKSTKTTCIDGKDEVYFVDTCGNPANIYDASKKDEPAYWRKIIAKKDSCGATASNSNANSASCGNCDYFGGSFCRSYDKSKDLNRPTYGDYMCRDLNCKKTQDGNSYKHGESWCVYDAKTGNGLDLAGSRQFKHVCIAGEEIVELCADFRSEVCIQDVIKTDKGDFQQAACRANRWQDCVGQKEKDDCLNEDRRDCQWIENVIGQDALGANQTTATVTTNEDGEAEVKQLKKHGVCVPDVPPGLKFWEEGEAAGICAQGNSVCTVQYEKGFFGKEKAKVNSECLSADWTKKRQEVCSSLGDCSGTVETCADGKCEVKQGVYTVLQKNSFISGTTGRVIVVLAEFVSNLIGLGLVRGAAPKVTSAPEKKLIILNEKQTAELNKGLTQPGGTGAAAAQQAANKQILDSVTAYKGTWTSAGTQTFEGTKLAMESATIGGKEVLKAPMGSATKYFVNEGGQLKEVGTPAAGQAGETGLMGSINSLMANTIVSSLMSAGAIAGVVYFASGLFGADANTQKALAAGAFAGTMTYNLINPLATGAGWNMELFGMAKNFMGSGGLGTAAPLVSWGLAIGIGFAVFAMMYKKTDTETIKFDCKPYEPPTGGAFCESCNKDPFRLCSEYRCQSLGQACKLLNEEASGKEKCVWVNPNDVNSPKITPWKDVLTSGHSYAPMETRPSSRGTKIVRASASDGCIKAFTPLSFGISTDEPTQCKIDYNNTVNVRDVKKAYESMAYYFGESNLYEYNHSQTMRLPGPAALAAQNISPEMGLDGKFTLFVRCQDANGNVNEDEFAIQFCVEKGPDTTPPRIEGTSIASGMPVQFNLNDTDIEVYVNEPASCKWSRQDKDYDLMENEMRCDSNVWEINTNMLYKCFTKLTGLENRKDNNFYFRCRDQPYAPVNDRITMQESYAFVIKGTQPLNIKSNSIKPNGTVQGFSNIVSVDLTLETENGYNKGDALCYYSTSTLDSSFIKMFETGTNKHKQNQQLPAGTYNYYFRCVDLGGNADYNQTSFIVEVDRNAPSIVRIYNEGGNLKVETSEKSTCYYSENINQQCNFAVSDGKQMLYQNTTAHYIEWKTNSNLYIKCVDSSGNQPNPTDCSIIARPFNSK